MTLDHEHRSPTAQVVTAPAHGQQRTAPWIVADHLTKRFGDRTAVDGLTFSVPRGVVTGFLGSDASGKTTTMRMILGLVRPSASQDSPRPYRPSPWPCGQRSSRSGP